jgi:glycosyltransferase involved in cell wall biosynthesis
MSASRPESGSAEPRPVSGPAASRPESGSPPSGGHVLFLNRRDCANPEGGGSEIYVETIARALVAGGTAVTIRSADFPGARLEEVVEGVRVLRRGSKLGMVPQAWWDLRRGRLGHPDVVVDVQNGLPLGSRQAGPTPTVVLVHHVHREQWPVVYGPVRARIGWALESRVAPWLYRECPYVAVSETTRAELARLGVDRSRIEVIRNGVQPAAAGQLPRPAADPTVLVLGRVVPHKRVEHVLEAAAVLRHEIPRLRVRVVGDGWWRERIEQRVDELRLAGTVELVGFVDEQRKRTELASAWVLAMPSLKEGWGLVITEAAACGVPAVGYRAAGGVAEVIDHEASGLVVDGGQHDFTAALRRVLTDESLRLKLSAGAAHRADSLSWQRTADAFAELLTRVTGRPMRAGTVSAEAHLAPADPAPWIFRP